MTYAKDDIVRIITKEEYRANGGTCKDDCAIARYGGLLARIVDVDKSAAPGHETYGIELVDQNFWHNERDDPIFKFTGLVSDYRWHEASLLPADLLDDVKDEEFENVLFG